jgi:hypothetical protein
LIDSGAKNKNDRTWCFWDSENLFNEITTKNWQQAWFKNENFTNQLNLYPYEYKMIKSADFYKLIFDEITKHPNIEIFQDKVIDFDVGLKANFKPGKKKRATLGRPMTETKPKPIPIEKKPNEMEELEEISPENFNSNNDDGNLDDNLDDNVDDNLDDNSDEKPKFILKPSIIQENNIT